MDRNSLSPHQCGAPITFLFTFDLRQRCHSLEIELLKLSFPFSCIFDQEQTSILPRGRVPL